MVDIDLSDVLKLERSLGAVTAGRVGALAAKVVRKVAADVERDAKILAPVDTGNLRNSISTSITGDGRHASMRAEIGPTASYGGYVEFGTSRMGPQPYLGPSLDRHTDPFVTAMEQVAEQSLGDL
ncbi:HK97-gp10 family putative phage morphogenesis protein [Segeticoccus rhizosphaerae]|uniref:HK97-gp10 family putative phage morphogenesis protein n=1 Tax=Segeticoccus rhizosphaerae TaxID=1104777 RepID=UPI001EEFA66B|nr:HK97-gp10 family putative phage morphogenesis protein [Segeticoccus rhizosphaerae]